MKTPVFYRTFHGPEARPGSLRLVWEGEGDIPETVQMSTDLLEQFVADYNRLHGWALRP